jgi:adenosylmethionine-8-amino-7-oxononanoate aminotransferase
MPTGTRRLRGTGAGAALSRVIVDMNQMAEFERRPLILSRGEGGTSERQRPPVLRRRLGVFVVNVGHGNRRVIDAMKEQLELITFAAPTIAANDHMLELAEALGRLTPDGMDMFSSQRLGGDRGRVQDRSQTTGG